MTQPVTDGAASGAFLTIDLRAVVANYRLLQGRLGAAACGAVVKADAYGLGAAQVAPALHRAGCKHFFVAHLEEGLALRDHLPQGEIYVMHGLFPGTERHAQAARLVPVLNCASQLARWADLARTLGHTLPAVLQIDTGMARFGFPADALPAPASLAPLSLHFVMSHLACADTPEHPANAQQRAAFETARARLPTAPASLAASSGIFLGPAFHYQLARPGAALYGVAPQSGRENPLHHVVRLQARVIQVRTVPAGTPVGYGHTATVQAPSRLATIAVGYADGFLRSASNAGSAWYEGLLLPILGRVSMDSIVLDASRLPEGAIGEGALVELIGPNRPIDDVATQAGTIGYELLTALGARYHRRYVPALSPVEASVP